MIFIVIGRLLAVGGEVGGAAVVLTGKGGVDQFVVSVGQLRYLVEAGRFGIESESGVAVGIDREIGLCSVVGVEGA